MTKSLSPPKPPDYTRKLARPLTLADGTRLVTLKDADDVLTERFSAVTAWGSLEIAIERLMQTATTGKREDIAAATDVIETVLRAQRLM